MKIGSSKKVSRLECEEEECVEIAQEKIFEVTRNVQGKKFCAGEIFSPSSNSIDFPCCISRYFACSVQTPGCKKMRENVTVLIQPHELLQNCAEKLCWRARNHATT